MENRVDALLGELPLIARLAPSRSRTTDSKQGAEPGDLPWVAVVIAALDAGDGVIPMRSATRFDFPVSEAGPYIGNPGYIHRSGSFQIDAYGYVAQHRREGQPLGGQLRVSRQGVLEWGIRYGSTGGNTIPSRTLAENVHDVLAYLAMILSRSSYFGRVRVWIRIENADTSDFRVSDLLWESATRPEYEFIEYRSDTSVENLLNDPMPLVRDSMDYVWQSYGFERAFVFDEAGNLLRV